MNKVKVTHWAPAIAAGHGDRPPSAPSAPKLGVCLQGGLPEGFPEWLGAGVLPAWLRLWPLWVTAA